MRNFVGTLAIGLIVLAVIGYFRGWLSLSSASEDGKAKLEISIDKGQLQQDTSRLKEGAKSLVDKIGSGSSEDQPSEDGEINLGEGLPDL
ncbi:MAG: hypothetical protein Aurels2KO_20160 [Aureliella sp.]